MTTKRVTKRRARNPGRRLTGEVATELGLSEQRIQTVLRTTPALKAQIAIAGGKRRWTASDVSALRKRLAELEGR